MSTFFNRPASHPSNPANPSFTDKELGDAAIENRRIDAEAAIMGQFEDLKPHIEYLRNELLDTHVEPDAVVRDRYQLKASPAQKITRLLRDHRPPNRHESQYQVTQRTDYTGPGWIVSESKGREVTRAIVLLETGDLVMTTKTAGGSRRKGEPAMVECEGYLELDTYPVHDFFTTEDQYAQGMSCPTPRLVTDRVDHGVVNPRTGEPVTSAPLADARSREANVSMNAERLTSDLYTHGRRLLGL